MSTNSSDDDLKRTHEIFVESLRRLAASLRDLDATSSFVLSHYRQLPDTISHAREMLETGATLVKGTSTKYTLLGGLDPKEQVKAAEDLIKGCQFVATGCVLIHEPSLGCCLAFRRHVKQASRAIVEAVVNLVSSFVDQTALVEENLGAQKTGVVWEVCDQIIEKKVPMGNRNSIRRDLFTYLKDCQETFDEFQQLVDLGPMTTNGKQELQTIEENSVKAEQIEKPNEDDTGWQQFLSGENEQYSSHEIPVATASLTLVKCSRGSINLTLQACEAVGAQIQEGTKLSSSDKIRLEWLEKLYQLACKVGDGMTDFGTNLYPPLDLEHLPAQIEQQSMDCLSPLVDSVVDGCLLEDGTAALEFTEEVMTLAFKLKTAIATRRKEALDSVAAAVAVVAS
ncbi:hypothetical protein ACA910_000846 [Epithemia clementina (nom. ined.)]